MITIRVGWQRETRITAWESETLVLSAETSWAEPNDGDVAVGVKNLSQFLSQTGDELLTARLMARATPKGAV